VADAAERLVNLALYLASRPTHVTANQCRGAGLGYPEGQDDTAFIRMFERDKDALRAAGLVIEVVRDDETESYRLDAEATVARPLDLAADEAAAVRAAAAGLAADVTFPFSDDLVRALGKMGATGAGGPLATADLTDGDSQQALAARALAEAVQMRKRIAFGYTNARGATKAHDLEPYGLFSRAGAWYLIGRDRDLAEVRTYRVDRMRDLEVNRLRPRTPDFERPADFDVAAYERLPFEYGPERTRSLVRFDPDAAWRAERVTRGRGAASREPDGSVIWEVEAADLSALASWIVAEGPGLGPVEPPRLVATLAAGLRAVVDAHV
jgi:proteasome accessory factor B